MTDKLAETTRVLLTKCPHCGQSRTHPAWDLLKFVAAGVFLTLLMWHNSISFDWNGELNTILPYVVGVAGLKWGVNPQVAKFLERQGK